MRLLLIFGVLGLFVSAKAQDDIIDEVGLKAFEQTLFKGLRASCVQCHGDGGTAIGHSVENSRNAYLASKQLVDFSNLENSRFMTKVRAKHWLRHDPNAKGMDVDQMTALLKAWWESGENRANAKFEVVSARQMIPANLPEMKDNRWTTITWDLNTDRAKLAGCSASVDIQRAKYPKDNVPGAYRVKNPKMKCKADNVEIQSVFYAISDEVRQYENIYAPVKGTIPKGGQEMLLSPEIMIVIQRQSEDSIAMLIRKAKIKSD